MAQNYERTMKQGDTGEPVRAHITQDSNGKEPDWSGATVVFRLLEIDDDSGLIVQLFEKPASVENPTGESGVLRYDWVAADTVDLLGRYMALFEVTDGTLVENYPREGYMWITVEAKTAAP